MPSCFFNDAATTEIYTLSLHDALPIWPIIGEAAKIGLYGFEALAQFYADPSGLTLPIVNEELFWGDAGIGMAIMGTSLAAAGIFSTGTPEQMGEWIPQCYGTPEDPKV